jgi:PAS domain S-box-containing protein
MASVLLVACPDSYRKALPSHTRVRTEGEAEPPASGAPDLVVIGPDSSEPTVAAQRAARAYPGVDVLIATPRSEVARLASLLRITPFIPLRTALVCCEPHGELEQAIRSAVNRCDFRQDHRRILASVQAAMTAPNDTSQRDARAPAQDDVERRRLARFFEFYDSIRGEVRSAVSDATPLVRAPPNPLRTHPEDVALPTDSEFSRLERRAVRDQDWQPYLSQLREVGRAHADLGHGFGGWLEIAHAFRQAVARQLVERSFEDDDLLDVVLGMESFLLATLREVARAHGSEQEARLAGLAKNAGIFAAAVESSEDAIFTTTVEGAITAHNQAAARLVDEADLVGSSITRFASDAAELTKCLTLAAGGKGTRALEMEWRTRERRAVQVSLTVSPVLDERGIVVGLSAIARDITDRKAAEASLRQTSKMEALGRLAGGIAHDFNNLLTIILGHAAFMQDPMADPSTFAHDLDEIVNASERARTLTGQLLSFSRKQPLRPEAVDLLSAVQATHQLLHRTLPSSIEISIEATGRIWSVQMDPGHVDQLLMNLALNARDAMPTGGQLRIEIRNLVLAEPNPVLPVGEYVLLAVHDTGHGIPPDLLSVVFDPFFTTKGPGHGTGIGLATCYSIVRQAQGDIRVSSEVGRGTSFRVWLPRAVDAGAGGKKRLSDPTSVRGRESILLVEDDAAVRATTARALSEFGYRVTSASDGAHALSLLEELGGSVDLVVSDVVMPRISGLELAARVRRKYPDVPWLFITGYADEGALGGEALPENARILLKPFLPAELARRVREVLDDADVAS